MRVLLMASLCLGATVVSFAAPEPKEAAREGLYFPTAKGTRWVYQSGDQESVEVVTEVVKGQKEWSVSVGPENGTAFTLYSMTVSEKGLCIQDFSIAKLSEPLWLLRLPAKSRDKWDAVLAGEPWGKVVGSATVVAHENVKVPAGEFRAVRVDMKIPYVDGRKGSDERSTWYAPNVGKVKEVRGEKIEVLKSVTFGDKR